MKTQDIKIEFYPMDTRPANRAIVILAVNEEDEIRLVPAIYQPMYKKLDGSNDVGEEYWLRLEMDVNLHVAEKDILGWYYVGDE